MKTSEAFKQAKQHLIPIGRSTYICHALAEAAYSTSVTAAGFNWTEIRTTRKSGFKTAINVITGRIGSEGALETWLDRQGIFPWKYGRRQMQAYRHRWLDALIVEFEAKGD
jgi:hypothetical protein